MYECIDVDTWNGVGNRAAGSVGNEGAHWTPDGGVWQSTAEKPAGDTRNDIRKRKEGSALYLDYMEVQLNQEES